MNVIWIVAANRAEAKIMEMRSAVDPVRTVHQLDNPKAHLRAQDINTERPGRMFAKARMTARKHTFSAHVEPLDHALEVFAKEIARYLMDQRALHSFSEIMLIAEPRLLGQLRDALDKPTTRAVTVALAKDIAGLPQRKILANRKVSEALRGLWTDPRRSAA